jgi:hypothetical protein
MKRQGTIIGTAALVLFAGCAKEEWDDCFTSVGDIVMDERPVDAFTAIDLSDRFDLVFTPDTVDRLIIEAGQGLLEQIRTEVIDGTLVIRDENTCNWVRRFDAPMVAHVHCHALKDLVCRGVGDVTCTGPITTSVFEAGTVNANGRISLEVDVDTCVIGNSTGAANIIVSGIAHQVRLYAGSVGPIDARGLHTTDALISHYGANDIFVRSSNSLGVILMSLGDTYYAGDPPNIWSNIEGSGQLIRLD